MKFPILVLTALLSLSTTYAQEQPPSPASNDSAYALDKEVVRAKSRALTRKESAQVSRIPLKNMENPTAYSVVPKELLRQQIVTDYSSAFKNIPGTTKDVQWMQGNSAFYSRGFSSTTDMRNGLSLYVISDIDPVNTERIEAIRGPAGALFGAGNGVSYGGLFNRVTKVPHEKRQTEVSYSAGSWNLSRVTADVNAPLNDEKTVLMRVNVARHYENTFQDQGFTNAWTVAPSLTYQVNDRLKLSLDLESYHRLGTAVVSYSIYDGRSGSIKDLGIPYRRSFIDNSLVTEAWTNSVYGKAEYKITDALSSETIVASSNSQSDLKSIYLGVISDSTAMRWHDQQNWKVHSLQFQQNFRQDFVLGPTRHQGLFGFGAVTTNYSWPYTYTADTVNFKTLDADYLVGQGTYRERLDGIPLELALTETHSYNAYVSDAIHFGPFTALLGLRYDFYDNRGNSDGAAPAIGGYSQGAFTPKVGLVYQPLPEVLSVYGTYTSGFTNVDGTDAAGNTFGPERAHMGEIGVKAQAPGGLLAATASVYAIHVRDVVRVDPANPNFSIQNGSQLSQGVEFDVSAYPLSGLSLVAGYAYNQSEMTRADASIQGLRPASAGPEQSANFWAAYEIPYGAVEGLGAGVGANYASEAYNINTTTQKFTVPAYVLVDATVFYDRPKYRIGAKVDNITNQKYWSPSYLQPGATRRYVGEVAYRF